MTPSGKAARAKPLPDRLQGIIQRILKDPGKGFGFVLHANTEYFFHATAIGQELFTALQEGDTITFRPIRTPKGPRAIDVERIAPS